MNLLKDFLMIIIFIAKVIKEKYSRAATIVSCAISLPLE